MSHVLSLHVVWMSERVLTYINCILLLGGKRFCIFLLSVQTLLHILLNVHILLVRS